MDFSPADLPAQQMQQAKLPPLPQLWVGYLLGFATVVAELVDPSLQNTVPAETFLLIPNLYLFLLMFVGGVY